MPKELRPAVFVWPSWISTLVAGEKNCDWAMWFKAHYKYDKNPSDFNLAKWTIQHTQLIRSRRDALERLGYKVYIEDQNSFKVILEMRLPTYQDESETIRVTISGKPDIIAIGKEEDARMTDVMHDCRMVEDCKTGSCKTSDHVQVMIYMLLVPKGISKFKGIRFDGTIVYKLGVKNAEIPATAAYDDESLKKAIWDCIKLVVGPEDKCRKIPSRNECGRCDITKTDCPERIG